MDQFKNKKIILGSKSPRRSQLLRDANFDVDVRFQDIDESFDDNLPPLKVAEFLAVKKAEALRRTLSSEEILITADSVVILDDIIYNKPSDYDEAFKMLKLLSDREHCVATGVCIITTTTSVSFTTLSYVTFDNLEENEIHYYIENFEPYDKAGSYGIQDWIGLCKVSSIRGSYSNIMGLPVRDVYNALKVLLSTEK